MLLFFIGLFSGIISGMGIGGGTILIPSLIFIIGTNQHTAQSINLASFLPTAIAAVIIHTKNKYIKYKVVAGIGIFGVAGAIVGSKMAVSMSSGLLKRLFGFFLLLMGIYELFRKGRKKERVKS